MADLELLDNPWFAAVFVRGQVNQPEEEVHFSRTLAQSGQTAYQLNDKHCTWDQYNDKLFSYNVITKAKNFLVFQVRVA